MFSQPVQLSRQGLDTIVFIITCYKYFKELVVDINAQCILLKELTSDSWHNTSMMAAQHAYAS